jgi:signal transduction histidine kinase
MIFIILIVGWYEQIKVDVEQELMGHQAELTAQVEEKTKELKLLNNSLESRIAKELEINHQQQEELIKKSRHAQMGEMISMIAHQWRQPLAAISSSVNTLKLRNMLGDYEKEYFEERLDRISSYAQHLSGTINDFRDFLKSQKHKKESSLDDIANGVFSIISPIVKNKNIELSTQYSASQKIMTYPNELKQVVLNLIQNAIDTLDENGIENPLITLRTYKKEDKLILEVEDNGGGIPKNIIENIFDPYYSTKKSKDGTGLGLYMSKIMVEEHCNGLLSVCNNKDGALFAIEVSV